MKNAWRGQGIKDIRRACKLWHCMLIRILPSISQHLSAHYRLKKSNWRLVITLRNSLHHAITPKIESSKTISYRYQTPCHASCTLGSRGYTASNASTTSTASWEFPCSSAFNDSTQVIDSTLSSPSSVSGFHSDFKSIGTSAVFPALIIFRSDFLFLPCLFRPLLLQPLWPHRPVLGALPPLSLILIPGISLRRSWFSQTLLSRRYSYTIPTKYLGSS